MDQDPALHPSEATAEVSHISFFRALFCLVLNVLGNGTPHTSMGDY